MRNARPTYLLAFILAGALVWVVGVASGGISGALPSERYFGPVLLLGLVVLGFLTLLLVSRLKESEQQRRRELEQAQREWSDAFDAIRDPVFLHDLDGRIVRFNRAYAELAGMPQEKLRGLPYWHAFPKMSGPLRGCQEALRQNREGNDELTLSDGEFFRSRAFAVRDARGRYRYSIHILEEMTSQRQAELALREREAHLSAIFSAARQTAFVMTDLDGRRGRILEFSPGAESLFGRSRAEMLGQPLVSLGLPDEVLGRLEDANVGQRPGPVRGESTLHGPGRRLVTVLYTVQPVFDEHGRVVARLLVATDITDRKRMEEALRQSDERFQLVIRNSPIAVFMQDLNLRYTWMYNESALHQQRNITGLTDRQLWTQETVDRVIKAKRRVLKTGRGGRTEADIRAADRKVYTFDLSVEPVINHEGTLVGLTGIALDISERKAAAEEQRLATTVFNATAEAVIVTDKYNRIEAVNPAFTRITGYAPEEVVGKDPRIMTSGRHGPDFFRDFFRALRKTGHWEGEIWNRRRTGELYLQWLSVAAIRGRDGKAERYVGIFSDVTKRREHEEVIRRQANFDALTELPNRILFQDRLSSALAKARRDRSIVALMYVDLDRFKGVNDTLGHAAGDQLLREVAQRLHSCVRESDTVARLGGDEFVVILPDLRHAHVAETIAASILESVSRPFKLDGAEAVISASVGITEYPADARDAESLMRNADTAMYQAKQGGRGNFRFFTQEMNAEATSRIKLEKDLREALSRGEFRVFYQPIIRLDDQTVVGAEALLRWAHPRHGMLRPGSFIELSEESGLMPHIGAWVLETVCRQAARWRNAGSPLSFVSINLSPRQCQDKDMPSLVRSSLESSGAAPDMIVFEITEYALRDNYERALEILTGLRQLGTHLLIDDFGKGFSPVSYLTGVPIDRVKIHQSFIESAPNCPSAADLVEGIVALAHHLHLTVIAEGAETDAQLDLIRAQHCDLAQGFHYSGALPAEQFEVFVERFHAR